MQQSELLKIIEQGENSNVQFKRELDNQEKIAAEMIAFANSKGGMLIFGVEDKTGEITGLSFEALRKASSLLGTIANESVKPVIYITTEAVTLNVENEEKNILIVNIEEGVSKPYKDKNGTIWLKQGADKRKLTDNAEILRLFQASGVLYIDEMIVPNTSLADIDIAKVKNYIDIVQNNNLVEKEIIITNNLLENLGILKNNKVSLAGLLFFGKNIERYRPEFCIKAISFFGNSIGGLDYRDSRDIVGTIPEIFEQGLSFFNSNLHHIQAGQNFNSTGILEISKIALEELLQNALIHRDYTINAAVRLMIFDNRIEIVSPGKLPNSLNIDSIIMGRAVVRNNLLRTFASKLMTYRGFGSGINRALAAQPNIEFINDIEGEQFIVKIQRPIVG